jgi:hypothetical protein
LFVYSITIAEDGKKSGQDQWSVVLYDHCGKINRKFKKEYDLKSNQSFHIPEHVFLKYEKIIVETTLFSHDSIDSIDSIDLNSYDKTNEFVNYIIAGLLYILNTGKGRKIQLPLPSDIHSPIQLPALSQIQSPALSQIQSPTISNDIQNAVNNYDRNRNMN